MMEACDINDLIQGFAARFIGQFVRRLPAAFWQAAGRHSPMRAVVLGALCAGADAAPAACGAQRYVEPPAFAGAYYATVGDVRGVSVELLYDHGKYAIRNPDRVRLYDGANPAVRWSLDRKNRIAQIDYNAVLQRLYRKIVAHGVDSVSRSTGSGRASLLRLQRDFPHSVVRNLDHLLEMPSAKEMADYNRTGAETVCGIRCIVYTSKRSPDDRRWIDPSTGFMLRWRYKEVPDNPRIAPQIREWQIKSFRRVDAVDASQFILPPGTTAELPRILADIPLPRGVKRKILTGKDAELGFPLP